MVLRDTLKVFGGFLAAILILGIILGAAGFFVVRNIDPNMFRAELENYLSKQTGFHVEFGDIRLHWRPQPQLQVSSVKFHHPRSFEEILRSGPIRIDVDLISLWQKRFHLSQVSIQDLKVLLRRNREGVWNWQWLVAEEPVTSALAMQVPSQTDFSPEAPAPEGAAAVASLATMGQVMQGWEFKLGKILLRDATVHFADETVQPVYELEIKKLEAQAYQKTSAASFYFTASGAVFNSAGKNLEAEGDLDLGVPSVDLVLRYGPEKAMFKGVLKLIDTTPHFAGTLEIRDLDIEPLIPANYKEGDYLTGRLTAKAQLAFDGANPERIQRSLAGQGTIEVREGALRNRNVIKEVFDRLSPVLAVTSALGGALPPEVNEMLKGPDTPFQSLQVVCAVQAGVVKISRFGLIHPDYQLAGEGTYGIPDKRVEGVMQLLLSKSISGYLVKKIREMELIADSNGQVVIPFRYGGVFPETTVQPDVGYIGSRLLQGGADQLLSRGLEQLSKKLGGKKAGQVASVASPEPASGEGQLIQQGLALFDKYRGAKKE